MTTSKQYTQEETSKTFKGSGGDVTFTPKNVSNNAGRLSARLDLGAAPRAGRYRWYAESQCQATPTVGNTIDIYLARWESTTQVEGDVGSSDAAFATENDLKDLTYIGSIIVDAATASVKFISAGYVDIFHRYVSVVWFNKSGATLTNADADHTFILTPIPPEMQ